MSETNGSSKSPTKAVARSLGELAHDAVTLADLQVELLKTELRNEVGGTVKSVLLLVFAVVVILGCVPVLLMSLAYALVELADFSQALSLLIATLVGLVIAGSLAALGWRKLRNDSITLQRSRDEFSRNVDWIKQVLKHKSNPTGSECETKDLRRIRQTVT